MKHHKPYFQWIIIWFFALLKRSSSAKGACKVVFFLDWAMGWKRLWGGVERSLGVWIESSDNWQCYQLVFDLYANNVLKQKNSAGVKSLIQDLDFDWLEQSISSTRSFGARRVGRWYLIQVDSVDSVDGMFFHSCFEHKIVALGPSEKPWAACRSAGVSKGEWATVRLVRPMSSKNHKCTKQVNCTNKSVLPSILYFTGSDPNYEIWQFDVMSTNQKHNPLSTISTLWISFVNCCHWGCWAVVSYCLWRRFPVHEPDHEDGATPW